MLARKTSKNQLTLPKEIVGSFPGIDLFDATVEENRIVLTPVKVTPITASLTSVRRKCRSWESFRRTWPKRSNGQENSSLAGSSRYERPRLALLFGGEPGKVHAQWVGRRLLPLLSKATFAEFARFCPIPSSNSHRRKSPPLLKMNYCHMPR